MDLPHMKLDKKQEEEYLAILAIFSKFLKSTLPALSDAEEIITALSSLRAEFAVHHALDGLNIDYEDALELIRTNVGLSSEDEEKRKIIVAAIDNIVDFAVVEEYHMLEEIEEAMKEVEIESEEDIDVIMEEIALMMCKKYNYQYAAIENQDIKYATSIAALLMTIESSVLMTYHTQGDERVRPWHAVYEGFTTSKRDFPAWLIPPIEHGCRCYLTVEREVSASVANTIVTYPQMPEWFNRTFKESVALGGRIFSDEHPYFIIQEDHADMLNKISMDLKQKYFNA